MTMNLEISSDEDALTVAEIFDTLNAIVNIWI